MRGRAQFAAGQVVSGDRVAKWVESWGTDNELTRPEPLNKR
jgi:predicted transcriptional regulator